LKDKQLKYLKDMPLGCQKEADELQEITDFLNKGLKEIEE